MLHDIAPEKLDLTFRRPLPNDTDIIVAMNGNKALLLEIPEGARLLRYGEFKRTCQDVASELVYLFSISGVGFYCCDAPANEPAGCCLEDSRFFIAHQPEWEAFGAVTAIHLGLWYAANRFCGVCGNRMEHKEDERALKCPACNMVLYPRISPVVIVAVTDGDRIFVARDARRPDSQIIGLIAGFVEVGETLEDAVRREVTEEAGLKVTNIRYYKSQPWAFNQSLLTGFYADLDGSSEFTLDKTELREAQWMSRGELTVNENPLSLTEALIEGFRTFSVQNHNRPAKG